MKDPIIVVHNKEDNTQELYPRSDFMDATDDARKLAPKSHTRVSTEINGHQNVGYLSNSTDVYVIDDSQLTDID